MIEFTVEGMTCGGCAASVRRTVQAVDGGASVEVDLANKLVRIESASDIAQLKEAITEAGYPVTSARTA